MAAANSVVKFDQTPDTNFFLCRNCKTHIAFFGDEDISAHTPTRSVNIETAVNLVNRIPEHILTGGDARMAYMVCVGCNTPIGWKYVDVLFPTNLIREGRYILFLDRLLFWSGVRIREGITALPKTESLAGKR